MPKQKNLEMKTTLKYYNWSIAAYAQRENSKWDIIGKPRGILECGSVQPSLFYKMLTMASIVNIFLTTADKKDHLNKNVTELEWQPTEQDRISTETSRSTPASSDTSASAGTSSPPRVGPSAPSAASADRTATQHPTAGAAVQHAHAVHDEICSDTMYNNEEVGNNGKTAFSHQCRMLFIPVSYKEGNMIENYNLCRRHIGVIKCENCNKVLVGLAKIRCHRHVCHISA
jgi:hypothetical protein